MAHPPLELPLAYRYILYIYLPSLSLPGCRVGAQDPDRGVRRLGALHGHVGQLHPGRPAEALPPAETGQLVVRIHVPEASLSHGCFMSIIVVDRRLWRLSQVRRLWCSTTGHKTGHNVPNDKDVHCTNTTVTSASGGGGGFCHVEVHPHQQVKPPLAPPHK